jgi:hypothetical protein
VAVDAQNVYWTDGDARKVQMAPKNGGGPVTTLVADEEGPPVAIAVDDVNVYWGSDGGHGGIRKASKCGGPAHQAAGGMGVFGIVPFQGNVYWNDNTSALFRVAQ